MCDLYILQQYFILRSKAVELLKEKGPHPYPHKFSVSLALTDFIEQFHHLELGQQLQDQVVSISGEKEEGKNLIRCTV